MIKGTIFNPAIFKSELESRKRFQAPSQLKSEQAYILDLFFSGLHHVSHIDFNKISIEGIEDLIDELLSITAIEDAEYYEQYDEHSYLCANQGFMLYEINRIYEASKQLLKLKAINLKNEDDFI